MKNIVTHVEHSTPAEGTHHSLPVTENLLGQTFTPNAPNEVWVTDITYIPTGEGWLYLAGVKDVFTCEIVGYAMAERMSQDTSVPARVPIKANCKLVYSVIPL